MSVKTLWPAALAILMCAPAVHAAPKLVVVPVTVGSAPVPPPELLAGLTRALDQAHQWEISEGASLVLPGAPGLTLTDEQLATLTAKLNEGAALIAGGHAAETLVVLEQIRVHLGRAADLGPRGDKGDALAYRAGGVYVAALLAANQTDKANLVAEEVALSFPGRKPVDADQIPAAAIPLLAPPTSSTAPKLAIKTRPEGCAILINGTPAGQSSVEIPAVVGAPYYLQASCPKAGGGDNRTRLIKIVMGSKETARQELLDLEFEKALIGDGGVHLHFESQDARKQWEDSYARRVADRFGADMVVLASVGEVSGAEWLSAKLYQSSGVMQRQGMVRLDVSRAGALGRYLVDGKDEAGVLKPEEANALLMDAQRMAAARDAVPSPWYTDIAGWALVGSGAVALTLGLWSGSLGDTKTKEADAVRNDSDRQSRLYRDAQSQKFIGDIGKVGGGLMLITGVILLAVPEYDENAPPVSAMPLPGGGGMFALSGRF